MKLKRGFGDNTQASELGYDLDLIIGWLEDMISEEEGRTPMTGKYRERLNKAYDAIGLLQEVSEL